MRLAICAAVVSGALAALCPAGELKVASSGPHQVRIDLPGEAGSAVTVTLTEGWGRTREPNKEWKAGGDKLPALKDVEEKR